MKKIILLPVLFLMLNFNSFSQNVIQGTVKNEKGDLIGGRRCAMIRLKQGNKIIHFTGSNYKGEYLISDISSGIYSIEAIDWESGSSVVYLNLIIDSGDINTINLEIKKPDLDYPLSDIRYTLPVFDIYKTHYSVILSGDYIRKIPGI